MKKRISLGIALILMSLATAGIVAAQAPTAKSRPAAATGANANATALALARAALKAQGGDKFRALKSITLVGTVDLYSPNSTQPYPAKFALVIAGERRRLEVQSAAFNLQQVDDGQQNYSSIASMRSPSGKLGNNMLAKLGQPGYVVTAVPDNQKEAAFRVTDAEGGATDFYVDAASGRVVRYVMHGKGPALSVENKESKQVEGVLVAYNFVQRLETPQGAFLAEFKVKEAKLNQPVGEEMFAIPAQ
jgi:hypothetical protein